MSQFDAQQTALNGAVFDFYGDPASITAGPLNKDRDPATTTAILSYDDVRDDADALIARLTYIEYRKPDWPHPRRDDRIQHRGKTWRVALLEEDTGSTLIVEVIP